MKTIEERAKEYAMYDTGIDKAEYIAYVAGAEEQRKIDIDKACKFLHKYAVQYTEPIGGDIDTVQMCKDLKKYVLEGTEPIFDLEE